MDKPLPMQVAEQLKQQIFSGEFQPGERLNEAALALQMNTSRARIREAMRILTGFGVVTAVPNRGVFVRQLSVREMVEVSDLRAVVFGFAAGLAAVQRTERDRARLEQIIDRMDHAAEIEDKDLYYRLNLEFHDMVVGLAHSERAKRLYDDLIKELHLCRRQNFDTGANMSKSNAEHRLIYEAIAEGDRADAARFAEQHVLAGCQRMLRTMEAPYSSSNAAR